MKYLKSINPSTYEEIGRVQISTLATAKINDLGKTWNDDVPPVIMQPNEVRKITMRWDTPETAYGNEVQSDSIQFDTVFRLIQLINGPTPSN